MKRIWLFLMLVSLTGCGTQAPVSLDPALAIGSPEEKRAVAEVQALASKNGYPPKKYEVVVRVDKDLGNFLVFLFLKTGDKRPFDRRSGIFGIVHAKTGQVIDYSDPTHDKNKPLSP